MVSIYANISFGFPGARRSDDRDQKSVARGQRYLKTRVEIRNVQCMSIVLGVKSRGQNLELFRLL